MKALSNRYLICRYAVRAIVYALILSIFLALGWVSVMVLWAVMTRG
jgi:hypothetical protein